MDEERIVRLTALASKGSDRPVDASERFRVVRDACRDLAPRLPEDCRPTLVLLDAKDLAGGVLEALLDFPREDTDDPNRSLAAEILGLAGRESLMLAVCMSQPSLEAWERDEWPGSVDIKEREFFVRLMENYRLGIVVAGIDDEKELIAARIHRSLQAAQSSYGTSNWKSRRDELCGDVAELYRQTASIMGKDLLGLHFGPTCADRPRRFLQIVARIDQFGKRPVKNIRDGIVRDTANRDALRPYSDGSYGLRRALKRAVQQSGPQQPALFGYLQAYDFFRDCARWLGDGVFAWARAWHRPERRSVDQATTPPQDVARPLGEPEPAATTLRALFIDETLGPPGAHDKAETLHLRTRISEVFSLLFRNRAFELHAILSPDGALPGVTDHAKIGDSIAEIDRFFEQTLPQRTKRVENWRLNSNGSVGNSQWTFSDLPRERSLRDYEVIFCEIDYRTRFAGPQVVQKLASYLERTASRDRRSTLPALIVLTHMDNIGHVQQCLNLGAHSFVNKERLYQIPSRLKRAVEDVQAAKDAVGSTGAGIRRERFGQHANFRMLYSLRPDRTAHLRNPNLKQLVVGGWTQYESETDVAEEHSNGAGRREPRDIPIWDEQDRAWIQRLPKADLHCHFGTSISLETIEALAFNTCGHLFRNWTGAAYKTETGAAYNPDLPSAQIKLVLERICKIVLHAAAARKAPERSLSSDAASILAVDQAPPPAVDYFRAMERTLGHKPLERIPDDPYGEIVKALMREPRPPIRDHFIVALLVAVTARLRNGKGSNIDGILRSWNYFAELSQWCQDCRPDSTRNMTPQHDGSPPGARWFDDFVVPAARLGAAGAEALRRSVGPIPEDHMAHQTIWARMQEPYVGPMQCEELWATWHLNIRWRLDATSAVIDIFLQKAAASMSATPEMRDLFSDRPCASAPTLSDLVVLPETPSREDHRLLRYLWGCGLLGAEHLQYPENIILAAHDLVAQNVDDNVVYTEVRCETPGYTRAGLSAEMATDLLCASFDLATTFERKLRQRSFVRTNILLAAKRHKTGPEIETVVSLLASYLRRRSAPSPTLDKTEVPAWWQPARVVGFDLSGDESKSSGDLKHQITRLIELSSPITIHAGEAASAESIWQAVYEYHARRIGHGLRLRERGQLLQFCINEGICMEMCPISNCFTSDFVQINWNDTRDPWRYDRHKIEHYPLRHFMEAGLEVCINTDNRSLHGSHYGRTLTDEFLWAARLSGGFTRWEVLKLVKAGFKHAFIDKIDAQELIQAVENWMFAQVANAPGLDWHPEK
jgi:adenosine deaminase